MPKKKKRKIAGLDGIGHASAKSETHKQHKKQKKEFEEASAKWKEVRREITSPQRDFKKYLGEGSDFVVSNGKLVKTSSELWMEQFEVMRRQRSSERLLRLRRRIRRKDQKLIEWMGWTWNNTVQPFTEITVNLAPWTQNFLYYLLKLRLEKIVPLVRQHVALCLLDGIEVVKRRTKNEIPFVSDHTDTNNIHYNLEVCYIGPDCKRLGSPVLGTIGPASVGYYRHARLHVISAENKKFLAENLDKYWARQGIEPPSLKGLSPSQLPLDLHLAHNADKLAEQHFGNSKRFQYFKACCQLKLLKSNAEDSAFQQKVGSICKAFEIELEKQKHSEVPEIDTEQTPRQDNEPKL